MFLSVHFRSLCNKYRPKKFSDVIGQYHIVEVIKNEILLNKIPLAFFFCGSYGTGKTTLARIIAMSLSCENKNLNTVDPCCVCSQCKSIIENNHPDIIEIDAASHTSVDDMRIIIENTNYIPTFGKYKIYIIDEVHMLSTSAFNAMLKTLEDAHNSIKFILATTDKNKVPFTIRSRCQNFYFKKISVNFITDHLQKICELENIKMNNDCISYISEVSYGSLRDALLLLDQAIVSVDDHSNEGISLDCLKKTLCIPQSTQIDSLVQAIFAGNLSNTLSIFRELYDIGMDVDSILNCILKYLHEISLHDDQSVSLSTINRLWQITFKAIQDIPFANDQRMLAEMLFMRLMYISSAPSIEATIKVLDKKIQQLDVKKKPIMKLNT